MCISLLLAMTACDKQPINGKLDGMWKLTTIEYNDGSIEESNGIYYRIQLHTVMIDDRRSGAGNFIADFSSENGVTISRLRDVNNIEAIPNEEMLKPLGLNSPDTHFTVEKLTGKHMILKSDYARLTFLKF